MNVLTTARVLAGEWTAWRPPVRVPETHATMDAPAAVGAYDSAGRNGVMVPTHLLHAALASDVIDDGDLVVDLACGPGGVLIPLAGLWPGARFIGVDLSAPMLALAAARARGCGLTNVGLVRGDITRTAAIADGRAGAVLSTMALHHLPDEGALAAALVHAARLLRPGGGVHLADFGQLRSPATRAWLATRDAARQPPAFTRDYRASLDAAFPLEALRAACASAFGAAVAVRTTRLLPLLALARSRPRSHPDRWRRRRLAALRDALDASQASDLRALCRLLPRAELRGHAATLCSRAQGGGS